MSGKLFQLDRTALREHLPMVLMFIVHGDNVTIQKKKIIPFILNFSVYLLIIGSCTFFLYIALHLPTIFIYFIFIFILVNH